jgi:integrase
MAKQKVLNDRKLKSLAKKPAPKGKRYDVRDAALSGFAVRVSETGGRTFVLVARYPGTPINPKTGARNPTRRKLGEAGEMTLEQARAKARKWLELIEQGKDPAAEAKRERLAEQRRRANTFAAVVADFAKEKLERERKGTETKQDVERELLPTLGALPITEIKRDDIRAIVKAKARVAPYAAHNLLGITKRLFNWAIDEECYGIEASPADRLNPKTLIGERASRDRILTDAELFALWRAAKRMSYPFGSIYQLLALTGLRLNEVADAQWREFDLRNRLWTIPADRMKGKDGKAKPHVVPLTDAIMAVLESLPRFNTGDYLFSLTFGRTAAWMSGKVKGRVDRRMLRTLRALARSRGEDPARVTLAPWVNHDVRRSVRSGLSRLKIAEEVREAVLGHVRPGIKKAYDLYDYLDEKRAALEQWAGRLRDIVEPAPANVVKLRA